MGYRPTGGHNHHPDRKPRKGKACPGCIRELEIEVGLRKPPQPPKGPGAGGMSPRLGRGIPDDGYVYS